MTSKSFFVYVTLSMLVALPAFSAPYQEEQIVIIPKPKGILEDSSEHHRIDKEHIVMAQIFGAASAPAMGVGITIGSYQDRNNILQFEISSGNASVGSDIIGPRYDMHVDTLGMNLKHFFGNSFYTKTGVDIRSMKLKGTYNDFDNNGVTTGSSRSVTGTLAIGNQWQWENFAMGVDWIGINPVINTMETNFRSTNTNLTEKTSIEKEWKNLARGYGGQLMRFHLGMSF
ncbi:hypothetical protein [Bdellovibrio sp. HCB337]|uniref:hypothetical protein n=1 Tax=Bdellovibrio sp. HCB337 TaxID=3394358 RepID=UPI0039A50786